VVRFFSLMPYISSSGLVMRFFGINLPTGGYCYRVDQGSKGVGSEILKHQIMDCSNVPLSGVSGFMVIGLQMDSQEMSDGHYQSFIFLSQHEVKHSTIVSTGFPHMGIAEGGTLVQVYGVHMASPGLDSPSCVFGNTSTSSRMISSSIIMCEAPPVLHKKLHVGPKGEIVNVQLSTTLCDDLVVGHIDFWFASTPHITQLRPPRGPSWGGTALHLRGSRFNNDPGLTCRFGNMFVRATYVNDREILCHTPSHLHGGVPVDVSFNGRDYSGSNILFSFTF